MTNCNWKNCNNEGSFPAPTNPNNLRERQYFCEQHIKEFNKQWNGLDGFSSEQIIKLQDGAATWNRPTWKMGLETMTEKTANFTFNNAEELYNFFAGRKAKEHKTGKDNNSNLPPDVLEGCAILGVKPPLCAKKTKQQYLSLVKKHHPDLNQNCKKSEEALQKINVAYKILQDYIKTS